MSKPITVIDDLDMTTQFEIELDNLDLGPLEGPIEMHFDVDEDGMILDA